MAKGEYRAKDPVPVRILQGCLRFLAFWVTGNPDPNVTSPVMNALRGDPEEKRGERNALARDIVDEVSAGEPTSVPYILFLRSFSSDGQMVLPAKDSAWMLFTLAGEFEREVDVETALTDALWQFAPVVALDGGVNQYGAGRAAVSNASWQRAARDLITAADTVVLVPGSTSGVTTEYAMLQELEALDRTVFVTPPCDSARVDDAREQWRRASDLCRTTLGFALPAYDQQGLLFTVGPHGDVEASVPFPPAMTTDGIAAQLRNLLGQLQRAAG